MTVRCTFEDEFFRVAVTDSGVGLDMTSAEELFQPFKQLDDSATRRFGGTGLGLSISRQIARLLGGDLVLTSSQLGHGSTFTLSLPVHSADLDSPVEFEKTDSTMNTTEKSNLSAVRVFIAEDEPINQRIIEELLADAGVRHYKLFSNGKELLKHFEENGADCCDLVLMDLEMPEMNGFDTTIELRKFAPNLPVIALTAHVFTQLRDKCFELGMVEHIGKPYDFQKIINVLLKYAPKSQLGD